MDDILIVAEHPPTHSQLTQVLERLERERGKSVTVLLHHRPPGTTRLMGDAVTAHGLPMQAIARDVHAEQAEWWKVARLRLSHFVGVLRAAGHHAHGEVMAGPFARTLLHEVTARLPDSIVLVTRHHRVAQGAHVDVERRLRRHTSVPVDAVRDSRNAQPSPDRV